MSCVAQFYKKHFLAVEFFFAFLVSIAAIGLVQYFAPITQVHAALLSSKNDLFGAIAAIHGTLLGFTATALSIITAFPDSTKLQILKKSPHFKTIYTIYFHTIGHLALTTSLAVFGLLTTQGWAIITFYLVLWSSTVSAFRLGRCIWVLRALVGLGS
jgi:hypothetical protein